MLQLMAAINLCLRSQTVSIPKSLKSRSGFLTNKTRKVYYYLIGLSFANESPVLLSRPKLTYLLNLQLPAKRGAAGSNATSVFKVLSNDFFKPIW